MKKSVISLAIAAGMAASGAAMAGDATVYGNIHLTIQNVDDGNPATDDNWNMASNTSAIGVKGSEDLGDGMKAIYKLEFEVAPDERNTNITDRDQFVGLKGGMGTVKFGTMSSNYKQTGGKIDPLYRTPIEGRGFLSTQSPTLHGGAGINRGRQTNTVQYESPKMGGMQAVVNTTVSGSNDETNGLGVRYETKDIYVFVDWIDGQTGTAGLNGVTEAATKIGGMYTGDGFTVSYQHESAEDRTGNDYDFLAGTFNIDSNNVIAASWGQASAKAANSDTDGIAVAYVHVLSKQTNVYVGYGKLGQDAANDVKATAFGIRKTF